MDTNRSRARALAVTALIGALTCVPALTAQAHEEGTIGPLVMEVGFGSEPAYTGQPNSVQFLPSRDGQPVLDLGDSVEVVVEFGGESSDPMTLEPAFGFEGGALAFGEPGDYRAYFTPSQPGKYTFHFTGRYRGTKIDKSFTSSPQGFSEVQDPFMFPAVTAPANEELATRIDQEAARSADAVTAAELTASSAGDEASSAKTLGILGIVLGAVGSIAAIGTLAIRRRT